MASVLDYSRQVVTIRADVADFFRRKPRMPGGGKKRRNGACATSAGYGPGRSGTVANCATANGWKKSLRWGMRCYSGAVAA